MAKTQNEVIAELLKNGAKSENVKVKNTKVKVLDKYTRCRVVLDKQVDGYGGVQTECFVGNDTDIGQMFGEMVGNQWDMDICSHQDGHL